MSEEQEVIEKHVREWIKTQDAELWLKVVRPYMVKTAFHIIRKHNGIRLKFQDDIINDMVVFVALKLITNYRPKKGAALGYIYNAIKNRYINEYRAQTLEKRSIFKTTALEAIVNNDGKQWEPAQPDNEHNLYGDDSFLNFYCEWWEKNAFEYFPKRGKYILKLMAMLRKKKTHINLALLSKQLLISYSVMRQLVHEMQGYNKQILQEYGSY